MFGKTEFKHKLGSEVQSKVTKLRGTVTSRSENLYGCNRYFIQPAAQSDMKVPEGWWVDEDDIVIISEGQRAERKPTGGPMSRTC